MCLTLTYSVGWDVPYFNIKCRATGNVALELRSPGPSYALLMHEPPMPPHVHRYTISYCNISVAGEIRVRCQLTKQLLKHFGCLSCLAAVTIWLLVHQAIVNILTAIFFFSACRFGMLVLPFRTNHRCRLMCTATPFLTATFRMLVLPCSSRNSAASLPNSCKIFYCNISDAGLAFQQLEVGCQFTR